MAEYRTGSYDDAITWLGEARTTGKKEDLRAIAVVFQAMAEFKAGNTAEGVRLLDDARGRILPLAEAEDYDNILAHLALEEARKLIVGEETDSGE